FYVFIWLLIAISMIINVIPVTSKPNSITLIKNAPKHSMDEIIQFNRDYLMFRYKYLTRSSDQYALNKLASAEKRSKSINLSSEYYGQVVIGGQKFIVWFDFSTSDLFVPSPPCECGHNQFNSSLSKTFRNIGNKFIIHFGATTVNGTLGEDILLAGGIKSDQIFGLTLSENGFFTIEPFDGVLGLGFDSVSNFNTTSPFSKMVKQKAVKNPYFGFHISRNGDGATLTLGDIDTTKFTGKLSYNKVSTINGTYVHWMTNMDDISINGKKLKYKIKSAIFDPSSDYVYTSSGNAEAFHNLINGANQFCNDVTCIYTVPCNSTDRVEYIFNGINYHSNLIAGKRDDLGICFSAVQSADFGGDSDHIMLIGVPLLKDVYSVYNIKDFTIGLAPTSKIV
ncbi:8394_t:CDS:2, partial [Racocetra persica]